MTRPGNPDAPQLQTWFTGALREAGVLPAAEATTTDPADAPDTQDPGDRVNPGSPSDPAPAPERSASPVEVTVGADAAGIPVVDVPAAGWVAAAACARDQLGFDFLDWLSAVDEPDADPPGLDVVLHLAATDSFATADRTVRRILLRTRLPDIDPQLPSLTGLWPGVAWHERETFEMFGVTFTGFDDGSAAGLRPLLLPDGFEGTPLRKSFVLAARASKPWPGAKDPGDSGKGPARRRSLPPGVPDPSWGPHEPTGPQPGPTEADS